MFLARNRFLAMLRARNIIYKCQLIQENTQVIVTLFKKRNSYTLEANAPKLHSKVSKKYDSLPLDEKEVSQWFRDLLVVEKSESGRRLTAVYFRPVMAPNAIGDHIFIINYRETSEPVTNLKTFPIMHKDKVYECVFEERFY